MTPFIRELRIKDPISAFAALKHLPYSLLLDSADKKHPNSRYSFILSHPIETIEAKDGRVTVTNWEEQKTSEPKDIFKFIASRVKYWVPETKPVRGLPPFQGGAAGYIGYDIGRYTEDLPELAESDADLPDMALGIYDQVLAFDHKKNQAWIITHAKNYHNARKKQDYILGLIANPPAIDKYKGVNLEWHSDHNDKDYRKKVRRVIDYIKDGDIFQANISRRIEAQVPHNFDSFSHYNHLRETNPAPFSAYMNCGLVKISSASPERFLTLNNRIVETKPIKGTRPRSEIPQKDLELKNDLKGSIKDRAENTMIVDLLRNDLSKVCLAKSIKVSELCALESFESVHHLVSTIRGQIKKNKSAFDLLRAAFPGGSITGAPKIRAMEIIEELEPKRRGPYCGSMTYIGFDGAMDSSILIRTLVYNKEKVSLQVGGGITLKSDPYEEYEETKDKAKQMLNSFKPTSANHTNKVHGI